MTDSMKFGPEWLRNMSADTASSNSTNTSSQITNSGGSFGSSGSSGDGNNNNNSSNLNTTSSNLHNSVNSANSGPQRNTFPEFRYGREEMLLLFDRNCGIPEILPSFKHLFVERVQFPLALVPSTDEELMQGSAPPTQRPVWLQRSPVGFSTSSRGTGRVGCMERGRIRGKSMYHPVFQRPNAMFEDDQRSSAIKTERPWAERNGGAAGGDPTLAGPATIGGLGSSDSWNGNTPASSPRREFSNHPRNMENWRRSRNEDGSSGGDAATTSATFSAEGGWRMNTSGFQNSHTRWGRSTSWRDEDLTNTNENSGIGSSIVGNSGGGIMMMRSNSAIATTHGERLGHSGVSNKQSIGTSGGGVARSISMTTSVPRNSSSCNIWPHNSNISQIANTQGDGGGSDDMTLPEWAMENPSDIGGTFDASGAFHGAIDDDENLVCNTGENNSNSPDQLQPPPTADENQISEKDCKEKPSSVTGPPIKTLKENDNYQEPSPRSPTPSNTTPSLKNSDGFSECEKPKQNIKTTSKHNTATPENVCQKNNKSKNEFNKESSIITSTITTTPSTVQNYEDGTSTSEDNTTNSTNVGDYAERMMKVTDDMIEKLIMDDDDSKDDHMKLSAGSKRNSQNSFVTGMQQSQNSNHHPSTVSPSVVPGGPTGPPNMGIYNMAGMMVDHPHNIAALHQLQQQQMAAVAAAAIGLQPTPPPPPHPMTSSSPTDLWLYRDPQAKVQGPFSALEMTEWYRAGYFNENLFVRRACDARYRPLGELIKICGGQMPFSNSHLIPLDLNPTPLHTPIVPVITAQPQANDFVLKSLSEHQQQHEKLKGNVTAAADSLSNALKSLINSVDISQVLNMHFQTLQDRFIHNQEMEIVGELSKNECFQRLSAAEQDAVVRQKLQMMVLPEYLTNLTGLSNSLAALNPSAGTQLYDTIAECTKKEQLFNNNHQSQPQVQSQQQQQRSNHHGTSSTTYMNAEDFIMKTKNSNHDMNTNDLLNEFNLRMFLNNGSDAAGDRGGVGTPNPRGHEFLNEQQMFGSGPAVSGATSTPNSASNTSHSPMMQMWMNSLAANQTTPLPSQQHSLIASVQQSGGAVNNQWLNGPLVGIPTISLSREQHTGGNIMGSPKPTPTSMWDVAALEHVQVQQQQQQHEQQMVLQLQQQKTFEDQHHLSVVEKIPQQDDVHQHQQDDSKQLNQQQNVENSKQEESQQRISYEIQKNDKTSPKVVSLSNDNKSEQNNRQSQQGIVNEKSIQQNKRNYNNNNGGMKSTNKAIKNENTDQTAAVKKSEEERRREQIEEKRRQKEEKKRQQMEEDKRRLMQAEEEKRRQMEEEEKRQQQIQAQRRKALMGSNASNANTNGNNAILSSPNSNQKSNKEQHRIQSSVAPWSTQTMASKLQGPGLAEIQKAERRERRADQQRQLEIQEKQIRALSAASEVQDTVLKWNAAPLPVKSFAEIQAEEAKRLVHEQMEIQKRKEQDAHSNITAFSSGASSVSGALNSTSNVASIWSGNKIWGTQSNAAGFWEEPFKYNNKTVGSGLSNSNNINNNLIASQSPTTQKSTTSQTPTICASQQQMSNKNIKKSQSVAVMQNASTPPTANSSGASGNQKKSNNSQSNKPKSQKPDNNGSGNDKKSGNKNNNNTNSANKCDDYEAEFVNWCTKSLNNMNTKVDVPTFVSFLRDLESPYEVKDYIRMYLGESKEYVDFAKQFLERRSKYKNLQRAQNAHDDDLCKPALAITPSVNDNSDNKGKQKKVKKNKMTKLDARILGFSVTAAEGRINVGDRDYGDAP